MNDDRLAVLEGVTANVLEQCAFLLTARAQRMAEWRAKDPLHALVDFSGSRSGWLRLSAPRELVTVLAEDMLGGARLDAVSDPAQATLRELANIVVGAVLSELFGAEESFELGVPQSPHDPTATPAFADRLAVTLVTESAQPFEVVLVLVARGEP